MFFFGWIASLDGNRDLSSFLMLIIVPMLVMLAMIIGVIIGTYSSIFVAAPILIYTKVNQGTVLKDDLTDNQ